MSAASACRAVRTPLTNASSNSWSGGFQQRGLHQVLGVTVVAHQQEGGA
jgi:hypothetical protein